MKMKYSRMANKPILARLIPLLWAAVLVLPAVGAQAGVVFTNLYSFTGANDGGFPMPGWCRAATAISTARLTTAARTTWARYLKSAPTGR